MLWMLGLEVVGRERFLTFESGLGFRAWMNR